MSDAATYALRLGDDALVLAQRLSEWSARAPELEEDLALTNIALDLLGQARQLLTRAGELEGEGRDEDDLAYLRGDREFLNAAASSSSPTATSPARSPASSCSRRTSSRCTTGCATRPTRSSPGSPRRRSRRSPTTATTRASGRCASATARRRATAGCRRASTGCGRSPPSCSSTTRSRSASSRRGSPPTRASCARRGSTTSAAVLEEATLERPDTTYAATGGRRGEHSEALGHLLADHAVDAPRLPGGDVVSDRSSACASWSPTVPDPEIPVLTIEDLGILRDVSDDAGRLTITLTPTYSGCPAIDPIRDAVAGCAADAGFDDVEVVLQLKPAWTTDVDEPGRPPQAARLRHRAAVGPRDRLPAHAAARRLPALRLAGHERSSPASARRRARRSTPAATAASRSITSRRTDAGAASASAGRRRASPASTATEATRRALRRCRTTCAEVFAHEAGQHVTIVRDEDGEEVRRSYSICVPARSGELAVGVQPAAGWALLRLRRGRAARRRPARRAAARRALRARDPAGARRHARVRRRGQRDHAGHLDRRDRPRRGARQPLHASSTATAAATRSCSSRSSRT